MENQAWIGIVVVIVAFGVFMQWLLVWRHPAQRVQAKVVGKRQDVSGGDESSVTTYYYLTLELAGGQRREFMVGIGDYSLLAERDSISCELQGAAVRKIQRLR
jgi:hypothetical protein